MSGEYISSARDKDRVINRVHYAQDLVSHLAKRGKDFVAGGHGSLVESYIEGRSEVEACFRWKFGTAENNRLYYGVVRFQGGEDVLRYLEHGRPNVLAIRPRLTDVKSRKHLLGDNYRWQEKAVFIHPIELVEDIQGFVPAFVWLKLFDDLEEFNRHPFQVFGRSLFKGCVRSTDGKADAFGANPIERGGGASEMIERATEVMDCVPQYRGDSGGDLLFKAESEFYRAVRLDIGAGFAVLGCHESTEFFPETLSVFACPLDFGVNSGQA